jgi:hypothetical protein
MHEGSPYGYLKVNLKVILAPNLARMVGATLLEVEGWIEELEGAGVFSRDADGAIYSRRMIRDETIREARASGGKLGGNPALMDNHKVGSKVNLSPNLKPTPSSSSSSSSAKYKNTMSADADAEVIFQTYPSQRRGGRKEAYKAIKGALKEIDMATLTRAVTNYVASDEVQGRIAKGEASYIPLLSTWLNKGRYASETGGGFDEFAYHPDYRPEPLRPGVKLVALTPDDI